MNRRSLLRVVIVTGLLAWFGVWIIREFVGPPTPPLFGPKLSFLSSYTPLTRIPRVESFKACDIYSFKADLSQVRLQIEHELGDLLSYRKQLADGISWSSATDDSGLEITLYPRKEWKSEDGTLRWQESNSWVSVYVYYPGKPERQLPPFSPAKLVGTWQCINGLPGGESTIDFKSDGTYVWLTSMLDRNRATRASGTFNVENGKLVLRYVGVVTDRDGKLKAESHGITTRSSITWQGQDIFLMGDPDDRQSRWERVE